MLQTDRLLLRRWRPSDRAPFAALNADPRVMECFPSTLTPAESDAMVDRIEAHFAERGFGYWAVEVPGVAEFIGFIGLSTPRFTAHFTPCVELGWRLAYEHWGHGYATEGAKAALAYGFQTLKLPELVAMTTVQNTRSRRVMEKLGMTFSPTDNFDHPLLPAGHPITPHVLYRAYHPLRWPTVEGALEVARYLKIDPATIDFTCQDWHYTYPKREQLPDFIRAYQTLPLSDLAKRTLGSFLFETLNDHLIMGGSEELVHKTLSMLKTDYRIHEPEFRYWARADVEEEDKGNPEDWFCLTRFAMEYVETGINNFHF